MLRRNGHGEDDTIVNGDSPPYNSEISILHERGNGSSLQHGAVNSLFSVADVCVVLRFRHFIKFMSCYCVKERRDARRDKIALTGQSR